jgi:hypothetical protein
MKRLILATAIICAASGAGAAQQRPENEGVIRGRVMDDTGLSVAGAVVEVTLQDGRPHIGAEPHAETDKDGVFVVDHLTWGVYEVFAHNEEGGYLDTQTYHVFYVEAPPPSAELTPKQPAADVLVQLPRGGKVIWSAADAITGKPVSVSMRMFRWAEGNGPDLTRTLWTQTRGRAGDRPDQYWMLAPPQVEVGLAGYADGYEAWRYPTPVRLEPGETLTLDIKLKPAAQ